LSSERRRRSSRLGAHPERRILTPVRRAALRHAVEDRSVPWLPFRRRSRARFVVLAPVVNMHARPRVSSAVVSQAILGMSVVMMKRRLGWALVETPDRYRGWIRTPALRPDRRRMPVVEVRSLLANIYAARDVTTRAPIAVLPMLARVEVAANSGPVRGSGHEARAGGAAVEDWVRVHLPDGRRGWAQSADVSAPIGAAGRRALARSPGRSAAVVSMALRFLGLPYLWGGITTFGLDCSGLVQLAHRALGIVLPRDADLQWADRRLSPVAAGSIRPGDLVFFGPRRGAITHVGIAIGRRAFVNATTRHRPEVRIERLDDPYWKRLFRGARRLPGD
jgi:cell wall-associated NlpC family hydrolase